MAIAAPPAAGIEHKLLRLHRPSIKAAGGTGSVSGYLSLWDTLDAYGDEVIRGAYAKTIAQFVSRGSLLHEHDATRVIGTIADAREDNVGLWLEADFHGDSDSQRVRQVVSERLARGKAVGLSIGYYPEDVSYRPPRYGEQLPAHVDQVRQLHQIHLAEGSITMFPALADAGVSAVKSLGGGSDMAELARLADRGVRSLPTPDRRPIGVRIATAPELKAFAAGHQQEARIDLGGISVKTLVSALVGPVDLRADLTEQPPAALSLVDLLPVFPTQSNRVSVPRVGTSTSAAAPVAEGALKAEATLTFQDGTLPVQNIAHWISATRQCLADAGEAEAIISTELLSGLKVRVEDQVLNGNGTSPNLAGILSLPGIGSVTVTATNYLAAVLSAMATVRSTSKRPATVVVLSPAAWTAVASAAAPGLLGMSPRGLPTLLGAEVCQSDVLPATTGLVGNAQTAPLFERQEASVQLGWQGSDFVRNLVTMLCEVRLVLAVSRQNAWAKVVGLP